MQPWFHPRSLLQRHEELAHLLAELLSIGSPAGLKPGVADVVLRIDAQIAAGTAAPVAAIRHPRVSPMDCCLRGYSRSMACFARLLFGSI